MASDRHAFGWLLMAGVGGALAFMLGIWALAGAVAHMFLWWAWLGLVAGTVMMAVGTMRSEQSDDMD